MLGPATLVGGNDVLVAIIGLDGLFQMVEIATAGIGFVAQHQARPLAVAHGAGAAIGQQVDVDILRAQEEGVVTRLSHRPLPVFGGLVMRIGSTIFIFHGSAQERRPNCWPIVFGNMFFCFIAKHLVM